MQIFNGCKPKPCTVSLGLSFSQALEGRDRQLQERLLRPTEILLCRKQFGLSTVSMSST